MPDAPVEGGGTVARHMSELDMELESLLDDLADDAPVAEAAEPGLDDSAPIGLKADPLDLLAESHSGDIESSDHRTDAVELDDGPANAAADTSFKQAPALETSPLLPSESNADGGSAASALAGAAEQPRVVTSPFAKHAVSDERIRAIIQEQLLELLDSETVQQKLFAVLALEVAVNPSALAELTGVRAFLKSELERVAKQDDSNLVILSLRAPPYGGWR